MKKKLIITTILAGTLAFGAPAVMGNIVSANDYSLNFASYNASQSLVQISAKVGNVSNQAVTLVITKDSPDGFSYDGNDTLVDFVRTENDGIVNCNVIIPSGFSGGKYNVYLFGRNESVLDIPYFAHISISDIKSLITKVNAVSGKTEMTNLIKENESVLVIDGEYSETELEIIGETMYDFKTASKGYTASQTSEFLTDFNLSKAIAEIKCGKPVSEVLKTYESYFGIDYEKDYVLLTSDAKILLDKLLAEADYSDGDVTLCYSKLKIYSSVKTASSYQKLQNIIEDKKNFELIDPDTKYYDKITDKSSVYRELANQMDSVNSFDDIAFEFYQASQKVYDDINDVKPSKGGGGSSSGKSSSAVYIPLDQDNTQSQVKPDLYDIESHWAKSEIEFLLEKGVVSGYEDSSFKPDNPVTRAEFVKLLCEAFAINSESDVSFDDVSYDAWYQPYIKRATGAGIVNGVSDSMFMPESYITRQDAALMLWRVIKSDTDSVNVEFTDKNEISAYAYDAVGALCKSKVISGFEDNSFRPNQNITRAQASVIISRAMKGE